MSDDARIKHIEEVSQYSMFLGSFCESMVKNMESFEYMLMQKLQTLRSMRDEMEELYMDANEEYKECYDSYARCPSSDHEERRSLSIQLDKLEHKKAMAQRLNSSVALKYQVAQGAIRYMLDNTNTTKKQLAFDVDKGRQFLKKVLHNLEEYIEKA